MAISGGQSSPRPISMVEGISEVPSAGYVSIHPSVGVFWILSSVGTETSVAQVEVRFTNGTLVVGSVCDGAELAVLGGKLDLIMSNSLYALVHNGAAATLEVAYAGYVVVF